MLFETLQDRSNEDTAAKKLEKIYGVQVQKLPMSYRFDFAVTKNGKLEGVLEMKKRNHRFGQFKTLFISAAKINAMLGYANTFNINAAVLVEFSDGYYICSNLRDLTLEINGKLNDRYEEKQIEIMAHIPIERFKKVAGDL